MGSFDWENFFITGEILYSYRGVKINQNGYISTLDGKSWQVWV